MKRGLSFLLALALCLSLFPVSGFALDLGGAAAVGSEAAVEEPVVEESAEEPAEESAEDAAADGATSGSCGPNATWTLSGGVLTISGSGKMTNYDMNAYPWGDFNTMQNITRIVIKSGITGIGNWAFCDLWNVSEVSIPSTVTRIGDSAFSGLQNLKTIDLPAGLTSIGDGAFTFCFSLENVTIPENAELGRSVFALCDSLNTAGPVGGGYDLEFYWTESIPEGAFGGCSGLTSIVIPDTVTAIGSDAFYDCTGISSIDLPDGLTIIAHHLFGGCSNLISIQIPYGVTTIESMAFYDCSNLENVFLPTTITMIEPDAFYDCVYLSDVYYSGTESQWNEIKFGWDGEDMDEELANATIHFAETEDPGELTEEEVIHAAYVEYIHEWLLAELEVNSSMTIEQVEDEFMPLIEDGRYDEFPAEMLYSGMLCSGKALTFEEFSAQYYTPAAPVVSVSCTASTGKPKLSWSAVSGATKYEVWRATSRNGSYSKIYTTKNTYFNNTTAEANKSYYYKVKAVNSSNTASEFSSMVSITCDCAQPVVSISTNASTGKPKLSWNAVSGATKYEVWRATSRNGSYTKIYTTKNTYFNNTTAVANKSYYYKVRAIGSSSYATSAYSSMVSITCDCAKPVVSISCNASTGKPKLSWSAVSGATKYEIWRATSRNGTYTKIYTTTNTYFNNTTAVANKSYYYKVRAVGSSSYATSAYSSIVSITCDCAKPVVTATTNSSGKPRLSWGAVDGAVKYEIWRSGYRNGTYTKIYTTTNTYFNNTSAKSGYTYFYKVRAVGSSSYATSAYSSIVSAKCK